MWKKIKRIYYAVQKELIRTEEGRCGVCLSRDIAKGDSFIEGDQLAQEVKCNKCGSVGKEWYNLSYYQTIMR